MSDTNSNAYRTEAQEKRTLAIQLNAEADSLETTAKQLENPETIAELAPAVAPEAAVAATEPETKTGLFGKKNVPAT